MAKARYIVSVCFSPWLESMHGYKISVDQPFTSKVAAERFAFAISNYLPKPDPDLHDGITMAWVLVYAMPATERAIRDHANRVTRGDCYLCVDPGEVICKRNEISEGFHGAPKRAREAA